MYKYVAMFLVGATIGLPFGIHTAQAQAVSNGVRSVRATSPIVSSGGSYPTLSCTSASASSGGCLTTGDQHVAGLKRFDNSIVVRGDTLRIEDSKYIEGEGAGGAADSLYIRGSVAGNSIAAEIIANTKNVRDAGLVLSIQNKDTQIAAYTYRGDILLNGSPFGGCAGLNCGGTIYDNTNISGHVALLASPGLYLNIQGQLPAAYSGFHGNITLSSATGMDGGYLVEVKNAITGTSTDTKLMIDNIGNVISYGGGYQSGVAVASRVPCSSSNKGTVEYTTDNNILYVCDSADWRTVSSYSTLSASAPGNLIGAGVVLQKQKMLEKGSVQRLSLAVVSAGADGAHSFTVDAFNNTDAGVCTSGTLLCNVAASVDEQDCTLVFSKNDKISIRLNDSTCLTSPTINVAAEYQ